MTSTVAINADVDIEVTTPGELALCIAAAEPVTESLRVHGARGHLPTVTELSGSGGRVHVVDAPTGELRLSYQAEASSGPREPSVVDRLSELIFRRPSRYCPSDRLVGLATAEFGGLSPLDTAFAVEQWLHATVTYAAGVTDATDDALHPLLTRTGVCRDFAHLGVAVCRALGLPARYCAVYAPGLDPMDFHAVYEVALDGYWWVFDGTRLAPRHSLVRIATGRDAADTAVLTPVGGTVAAMNHDLVVVTRGELPQDDRGQLVALA